MKTRNLIFGLFGIFIMFTLLSVCGCSGHIHIRLHVAESIKKVFHLHPEGSAYAEPTINGTAFYGTDDYCAENYFFGTYPLQDDGVTLGVKFYPPSGYHTAFVRFTTDNHKWNYLDKVHPKVNIKNEHNGLDHQYYIEVYYTTTDDYVDNLDQLVRSDSNYIGPVIVKLNVRHYEK